MEDISGHCFVVFLCKEITIFILFLTEHFTQNLFFFFNNPMPSLVFFLLAVSFFSFDRYYFIRLAPFFFFFFFFPQGRPIKVILTMFEKHAQNLNRDVKDIFIFFNFLPAVKILSLDDSLQGQASLPKTAVRQVQNGRDKIFS